MRARRRAQNLSRLADESLREHVADPRHEGRPHGQRRRVGRERRPNDDVARPGDDPRVASDDGKRVGRGARPARPDRSASWRRRRRTPRRVPATYRRAPRRSARECPARSSARFATPMRTGSVGATMSAGSVDSSSPATMLMSAPAVTRSDARRTSTALLANGPADGETAHPRRGADPHGEVAHVVARAARRVRSRPSRRPSRARRARRARRPLRSAPRSRAIASGR